MQMHHAVTAARLTLHNRRARGRLAIAHTSPACTHWSADCIKSRCLRMINEAQAKPTQKRMLRVRVYE